MTSPIATIEMVHGECIFIRKADTVRRLEISTRYVPVEILPAKWCASIALRDMSLCQEQASSGVATHKLRTCDH